MAKDPPSPHIILLPQPQELPLFVPVVGQPVGEEFLDGEVESGRLFHDGLSIAMAVAEYLHDTIGARTQFATHYHEMTELAAKRAGIKNYNVAIREYGDQIVFLRQIVPGAASKSYGIHVAKLADLPGSVVTRAGVILEKLEDGSKKKERELWWGKYASTTHLAALKGYQWDFTLKFTNSLSPVTKTNSRLQSVKLTEKTIIKIR